MKDSEILEAAKAAINKGTRICYAIASVDGADRNQQLSLIAWISHMLGDEPYYETWMMENHPEVRATMTPFQFQQARLHWVDWMITQCRQEEAK